MKKRGVVEVEERRILKEEERPYRPYGTALGLMKERGREVLLAGPAGTGKSRACLEKLNLVAMQEFATELQVVMAVPGV